MPEKISISARIDADLIDGVDRECAARTSATGETFSRTHAIEQALRAWLGQTEAGAYYPSQRERDLLDGLRRLTRTRPEAVTVIYRLAENAIEDPEGAVSLARAGDWLSYWAARPQESKRRVGERGSAGSGKKGPP